MSNTAEQKALEAYPIKHITLPFCFSIPDLNEPYRKPYQEGYDQAIQDFEEFLRKNNRGQLIRRFEDYIFKEKEEE